MSTLMPQLLPGVLGHELRNPLAAAMTGALLLREMLDTDDTRGPVLDSVLHDLERIKHLIDGWLQVARAGVAPRRELSVDELLARVAVRHGAQVVGPASDAEVAGDPSLLERALDNLLENARQAGARHVRLAAQVLGGRIQVHVEDDGPGIAPAQRERLFRPGSTGRGGHGLGLYAVATTVAAHAGTVQCVPLTRGTRFTITLPLAAACPALV
ncbi:MAG: HAMP domain-containing histidine kinase [Planctomycetes bacterium]|nr:HAMP domain-containing histidine kinase [Planctomycetota bacterium]